MRIASGEMVLDSMLSKVKTEWNEYELELVKY